MPQTFELFPRLPIELRFQIWNEAHYLFPRIIEIRCKLKKPPYTLPPDPYELFLPSWIVTPTSALTLLSVNRETRTEFIRHYSSDFNPATVMRPTPHMNVEHLLVNWEHDTLYLNLERPDLYHSATDTNTIFSQIFGGAENKVAKEVRVLAGSEYFWFFMLRTLWDRQALTLRLDFTGLDEVILVSRNWGKAKLEMSISNECRRLVRFEDSEKLELMRLPLARDVSRLRIGTGPIKRIFRLCWDTKRSV